MSACHVHLGGEKDAVDSAGEQHKGGVSCLPQDFKERVRVENVQRVIVEIIYNQHVRALNDCFAQLLGREFRLVIGLGRRRLDAPTRE
jgi:hypothetical protein